MKVVLENLSCIRGHREVLAIDQLEFAANRITAILGANGAGKTTMLRAISGLERPAHGRALLDGRPAERDRATSRAIGFAFQESVFLRRSVRENLELGLELRGVDAAARRAQAAIMAERCGVAELLDRPALELSGGEARRVNIARALVLGAPLLLLDEPLDGLDGHTRERLLHELPALLAEHATTTLLVTHRPGDALWLAEELVVLDQGRVLAAGAKQDIWQRPPDAATAGLLGHTVVESVGVCFAIPAGGLREGSGDPAFELVVEGVTQIGIENIAFGRIGDAPAQVTLPSGRQLPTRGDLLQVHAPGAILLPDRPTG